MFMKKRKLFLPFAAALLAFGLAGCSSDNASGETGGQGKKSNYPNRAIQMIVPFAPGGTTDSAARALASVANKYLPNGQTVAIVNKDGGAGTIGMNDVAQAKG